MNAVHVYTRDHQPATRYRVDFGTPVGGRWFRNAGNRLLPTRCCGKLRPAKNLTVQTYYDDMPLWCRPGTGCKVPSHRKRVANKRLVAEFQRGLSFVGLARKYGMTNREVQDRVRKFWNRKA